MTISIVGYKESQPTSSDPWFVNTTSMNAQWKHMLSPFFLGPCKLYNEFTSHNVENAWQYAKVYPGFGNDSGPFPEYFKWAKDGWNNTKAVRYPMGKGAKPLYSWWDGKALNYIDARKEIYVPLYKKALEECEGVDKLLELYRTYGRLTLWDFDGYNAGSSTLDEVLNDPSRTMGHAFLIKMVLDERLRAENAALLTSTIVSNL